MSEVEKPSKSRGEKQIKDAELGVKSSTPIIDDGIINASPLELDESAVKEIMEKQAEDDTKRDETKSATQHYGNGINEWKLIQKTYNNVLDWEHITTAMAVGTRGVIVHVKEAVGQKINSTSMYIDNGRIFEKDGKYFIK